MNRMALAAMLLVAGCSPQPQSGPPKAGATASSTPSRALLAVVRGASSGGPAAVTIVASSGVVMASAAFELPARARLGPDADLPPPPVRVAAGSVFYADAHGVVRRLDRDGRVATVTTFPITSAQQELSFAVSPDGRRLLASILSAPPVHDPPPRSLNDPFFVAGGRWSLEILTAAVGGSPTSTFKRDLGTTEPRPTIVAGWDRAGPLATLETLLETQQPPLSMRFTGSALVHLAPDGSHLDQVGGSGCSPLDELSDGTVLCLAGSAFEVRSASGDLRWRQDLGGSYFYDPRLSPDGGRIASEATVFSRGSGPASAARQAGSTEASHFAQGWLDGSTIVASSVDIGPSAVSESARLMLVDAGNPSQVHDLGVTGAFIGAV
jgi:hypothetical protein